MGSVGDFNVLCVGGYTLVLCCSEWDGELCGGFEVLCFLMVDCFVG